MELHIITAGVSHNLSDKVTCWLISQDNVGMATLHRMSARGPQQHGDSDRGFLLDPRFPTFIFGVEAPTMDTKRDTLISWFKPRYDAFILEWIRDDAAVRRLDCHFYDQMRLGGDVRSHYWQKVPITVKAGDPTFYDPVEVSLVLGIAGGIDEMVIPLPIPWPIGAAVIDALCVVTYVGSWLTYPIIVITGPITNCVITNEATGEKLDFTGVTIAGADTYTINLTGERKTVVNAAGANKIADLTADSDTATWHIEAAPDAPGGINTIHVTGTGANAATAVRMRFLTRYLSL